MTKIDLPDVGSITCKSGVTGSEWEESGKDYVGAFQGCTALTSVTMKSANFIGASTFKGCTELRSVTLPEGISSIGAGAFYGCTALVDIEIPSSIATIDPYAFKGCTSLSTIAIPDFVVTIEKSTFENCTALENVTIGEGITTIGERAFYGDNKIKNIVFPDVIDTIGAYAFYNCTSIQAIELPESTRTIGTYAFGNCSGAATITVADGVETFEDYAFAGCSAVTNFNIPATVINLGIGVFDGWTSLKELTTNGSLDYAFKDGVLYNSTYTKILYVSPSTAGAFIVDDTITSLAEGLFANTKITSIVLPNTIREIPARAFMNCASLETVKMPANITRIGEQAFRGCTSLKEITIPKSVYSVYTKEFVDGGDQKGYYVTEAYDGIGHAAFYGCTSLENVIFEAGGTERLSFGDFAFYGCTSLKGTLDEKTGEYTFVIPSRVRGDAIPSAAYVHPAHIGSGQGHTRSEQGVGMFAFARTGLENVVFEEEGTIKMTEKLIICVGAFQECMSLKTVTFGSTLGDISMSVPGGKGGMMQVAVAAISKNAFYGCKSLKSVTAPKGTGAVSASSAAFDGTGVTPEGIAIVGGSFSGESGWQENTQIDYRIDGCYSWNDGIRDFSKHYNCKYYDPHNGIFLPEDPWVIQE